MSYILHQALRCPLNPAPCLPRSLNPAPCLPGSLNPAPCLPGSLNPAPCLPGSLNPSPCLPGSLIPAPCPPGSLKPAPCLPGSLNHSSERSRWAFSFSLSDLRCIRVKEQGWSFLLLQLSESCRSPPALHFHQGGSRDFLESLGRFAVISQ